MNTVWRMAGVALLLGIFASASAWAGDALVVEAEIPVAGDFMAFDFGSLWMAHGGSLARVNPADNSVTEIALTGNDAGPYRSPATGEGAVWIPSVGNGIIHKIDPETNTDVLNVRAAMQGGEGTIAVGAGSVWVVTKESSNRTLTRLRASDGAVQAKIELPDTASDVLFAADSVWITGGFFEGRLFRIDPATNAVISTTSLNPTPRFLTAGEGAVWVLTLGDGSVQRVDPASAEVVGTIETGLGGGGDITTGGGRVWVTVLGTPVVEIDPATNSLVDTFTGANGMRDAIRYGAGSLWVSGSAIYRITPPH